MGPIWFIKLASIWKPRCDIKICANVKKYCSYPLILFEMSTPWPGAKHLDAWTTDCISIDKVNIFHLMIFLQIWFVFSGNRQSLFKKIFSPWFFLSRKFDLGIGQSYTMVLRKLVILSLIQKLDHDIHNR